VEASRQKWINFVFLILGAILAFLVSRFVGWVQVVTSLESRMKLDSLTMQNLGMTISLLSGAALFAVLRFKEEINVFAHEVFIEFEKVSWIRYKESLRITSFVVVLVILAGVILGAIDSLWSWLLSFIF
jgi:preprotein translocase SecE subunit